MIMLVSSPPDCPGRPPQASLSRGMPGVTSLIGCRKAFPDDGQASRRRASRSQESKPPSQVSPPRNHDSSPSTGMTWVLECLPVPTSRAGSRPVASCSGSWLARRPKRTRQAPDSSRIVSSVLSSGSTYRCGPVRNGVAFDVILAVAPGFSDDVANSVQDAEAGPSPERAMKSGVVPVLPGHLAPAATGPLAIKNAVERAAGVCPGTPGAERRVQALQETFHPAPGAVGDFPFRFRRCPGPAGAPVGVAHVIKI
jgi:hypothetical protein